jgi:hypothetical protein
VFAQIASSFELLLKVDWSSLFKSFYEDVRIKIACMSPSKIPPERLFELDKKVYLITIVTEGYELKNGESSKGDGDDSSGDEEDEQNDDDVDDFPEQMDTDKSNDK